MANDWRSGFFYLFLRMEKGPYQNSDKNAIAVCLKNVAPRAANTGLSQWNVTDLMDRVPPQLQ